MNEIEKTIRYYEENAKPLIDRYNSANMDNLYKILLQFLNKNEKILEIGFGSGRDMRFLLKNGYDVYGVEASKNFIEESKKDKFIDSSKIFYSSLPNLILPDNYKSFFDVILMVAVFMHIPKEYYEESIKSISKYLKDNAKIIISYSLTKRDDKERFFEEIDKEYLIDCFKKYNFVEIFSEKDFDVLNREIEWETVVFERRMLE